MNIYNNQKYFTNKQLNKIVDKLGAWYKIESLYIIENKHDLIRYRLFSISVYDWLEVIQGDIEGLYLPSSKTVILFIYAQADYKDFQSSQLYSIHALLHELRHAYHKNKGISGSEQDCDDFATKYLNKNSKFFSKIMKWDDEWEVEEEN